MNILVISKEDWIPSKLKAVQAGMRLAKNNETARVKFLQFDYGSPDIENERVTHSWFERVITPLALQAGCQGAILHVSKLDAKRWGVQNGLRGLYFGDKNHVAEMWAVSDENEKITYNSGRQVDRFTKVALHELSHAYAHWLGVKDNTHYWDYEKENIAMAFTAYTIPIGFWQNLIRLISNRFGTGKKLLPEVQRKADSLVTAMNIIGHPITLTSTYRSCEEQDALYAKGRTEPGAIVTNARCGESLHNYGVAFDVAFLENGKPSWSDNHPWFTLGLYGEILGLEWGGKWSNFPDKPHFQLTYNYSLNDFQNGNIDYSRYY